MDYAVLLYFEEKADCLIDKWTQDLVKLGLNSRFAEIGMKPHLTLAEFDLTDLGEVENLLKDFASWQQPVDLKFSSLGVFPGENSVLFLNPVVSERLVKLHQDLNSLLGKCCNDFSPLYTEEHWVPHCTLALDYDNDHLNQAMRYLGSRFLPIDTKAVSIVLYGCCPYHEMMVLPLNNQD
ncbi:MAG: 2'-5' RNA ligase family protein [Clostridiaceae bacterium]|nr:2'-5' RNA ligase family protein [Clostridiaceae bacterium]